MRIVIAIPALNEARVLRDSAEKLRRAVADLLKEHDVVAVIADNGSDDGTPEVGLQLARDFSSFRYLRVDEKGKGRAIRAAWSSVDADAYVFMDADLSTDPKVLPDFIGALARGADLAIGSRFIAGSKVKRSLFRRFVSRGYRLFLRLLFGTSVNDAPCGAKAVSARVMREIAPRVLDNRWFFDTELVLRAERAGLQIKEVPVEWREPNNGRRSKVAVFKVIREYLAGCRRLRREFGGPPAADTRPSGLRANDV